jgi:xyloglucan-specific exo-beta-1,4-glucanase
MNDDAHEFGGTSLLIGDMNVAGRVYMGAAGGRGLIYWDPAATSVTYVSLANRATSLRMDGIGRTTNGSNCGQWSSGGSFNQQWVIETVGNYVMLKNRATGLYLDGMYRNSNGSVVGQFSYSGSDAQYWTRETVGSYAKFKNKATGLYIDGMGLKADGSDLGQWKSSNHFNQQWSVTTIGSLPNGKQGSAELTEANEFNVKVYPNPFAKTFTIEVQNPDDQLQVTILDAVGKAVETAAFSGASGKLSLGAALKPGIYIVRVNSIHGSQTFKIMKE